MAEFQAQVIDAIKSGDLQEIRRLVIGPQDINKPLLPTEVVSVTPVSNRVRIPTIAGPTPLILAILCERTEIVQYLLDKKNASIEAEVAGFLPIHYACIAGVKEIVRMILEKDKTGKMINATTVDGYTPLHIAAANEHLQIVLLLLKNDADPTLPGGVLRNTALHVAMRNQGLDVARCLIAKEDSVLKLENQENQTPLHLAMKFENRPMVDFIRSILNEEAQWMQFEALYLELVDEKETREVMYDVVNMMSKRVNALLTDPGDQID